MRRRRGGWRRARAWRSATRGARASWRGTAAGMLRERAEDFVRAALRGETAGRPWLELLALAKEEAARASEAQRGAGGGGAGAAAGEGAQTPRARSGGSAAARGAAGAHARAWRVRCSWRSCGCATCGAWRRGAGELVYNCDRLAELERDAAGRGRGAAGGGGAGRRYAAAAGAERSEELALEALAYRLQELLGGRGDSDSDGIRSAGYVIGENACRASICAGARRAPRDSPDQEAVRRTDGARSRQAAGSASGRCSPRCDPRHGVEHVLVGPGGGLRDRLAQAEGCGCARARRGSCGCAASTTRGRTGRVWRSTGRRWRRRGRCIARSARARAAGRRCTRWWCCGASSRSAVAESSRIAFVHGRDLPAWVTHRARELDEPGRGEIVQALRAIAPAGAARPAACPRIPHGPVRRGLIQRSGAPAHRGARAW